MKNPSAFFFQKHLLDYIYKKMLPQDEKVLEEFLNQHQAYAETMDRFLKHCIQKRFKRPQLIQAIENNIDFYQKEFPLFFYNAFASLTSPAPLHSLADFLNDFWQHLQQWFQPHPPLGFNSHLMSNAQLMILSPTPEMTVENDLTFELLLPIAQSLKLQIFDTQQPTPIYQQQIPPHTKNFDIDTNTTVFHPGIFYWILGNMDVGQQQGSFILHPSFRP